MSSGMSGPGTRDAFDVTPFFDRTRDEIREPTLFCHQPHAFESARAAALTVFRLSITRTVFVGTGDSE